MSKERSEPLNGAMFSPPTPQQQELLKDLMPYSEAMQREITGLLDSSHLQQVDIDMLRWQIDTGSLPPQRKASMELTIETRRKTMRSNEEDLDRLFTEPEKGAKRRQFIGNMLSRLAFLVGYPDHLKDDSGDNTAA